MLCVHEHVVHYLFVNVRSNLVEGKLSIGISRIVEGDRHLSSHPLLAYGKGRRLKLHMGREGRPIHIVGSGRISLCVVLTSLSVGENLLEDGGIVFGMKGSTKDEFVDSFEFHVSCDNTNARVDERECRTVLVHESLVSPFVTCIIRHVDGKSAAYLCEVEAVDGVVDVALPESRPEGPHVVDSHHMRVLVETGKSSHLGMLPHPLLNPFQFL